jgi:hypothetical protein
MRNLIAVVAGALIAGVILFGLNWYGIVSQDAARIGLVVAIVVGIMMTLVNRRRGGTG